MENNARNELFMANLHQAIKEQDMDSAMEFLQELIDQEKQPAVYFRMTPEVHSLISSLVEEKMVSMLEKAGKTKPTKEDADYFLKYTQLIEKLTN